MNAASILATIKHAVAASIVAVVLGLVWPNSGMAALSPAILTCEYAVDPLGVDVGEPRLSWKLQSEARGQIQSAWQVLASSSESLLAQGRGDLWDSGKVNSGESLYHAYAGRPLKSSQQVFWKVRVWDQEGKRSEWTSPASWTMGVLAAKDWQAKWIGASDTNLPNVLLRREFMVKRGLKRAVVHACGLAQYELFLNGRKSGNDLLTPGWSKYDKTCLYDTHDVTALLNVGENVIGLALGNGMYRVTGGRYVKFKGSFGPLKAIAQLRLEYADGSVEIIGTDRKWQTHAGPLTFSCVYGGEDFDARLNPVGWNQARFDAGGWEGAVEMSGPGGVLRGHSASAPPLRIQETIAPVSIKPLTNGVEVYDLGQNAPIMPRIVVSGPAGSVVRIIPAELLKEDGSVDRTSVGRRMAYWQYTLAGARTAESASSRNMTADSAVSVPELESWFPQFFYHGCRYLQVERMPAAEGGELPEVVKLEGEVVHSVSRPVGEFECSNELFNRIRTLVRWAQRGNMVSVLTDCPHRERLGWLEQYHLNGPSLRYEFDVSQLFAKGMNDMKDSQLASGMVPSIAPEYTIFGKGPEDESNAFRNSPEWGSAIVLVPWQQYEFDGDTGLMRRYYDEMKRYVAYLESRATNDILSFGLGDWYDIGPKPPGFSQLTPKELTATAFYFRDTQAMAKIAEVLGRRFDAKQFAANAQRIRASFNREFYNATNGSYSTGSQCANAIPLVMGLVEETNRSKVLNALVTDVESRGNAITAGDVGFRYLLRALAEAGRSDVIFAMNDQSDKPGYGYQLKMGATSLTEAWTARRANSQNHFMLGQIMEWFYGDLAGIAPDPLEPGFKNIIIRPQPVGDLTWARASYESVRGRIESHWQRDGNQFALTVVVPANCAATVYLPARSLQSVRESGKPVDAREGVTQKGFRGERAILQIGSGKYEFASEW